MSNVEGVGWPVGLLAAGVVGVLVSRATTPPEAQGNTWDSSLFYPMVFAVALLCAVGGYRLPSRWFGLGLVAVAPYLVNEFADMLPDDDGLAVIAPFFMLVLSGIVIGGARLGAVFGEARERSADR